MRRFLYGLILSFILCFPVLAQPAFPTAPSIGNITFSGINSFSGSSSYSINGSQTDLLRFTGGGTSGGMIFYANSGTGNDGLIRFRNNSTDNTQGISFDAGTGSTSLGSLVSSTAAGSVNFITNNASSTGFAPFLFSPNMSDSHTVGVFVAPAIGSLTNTFAFPATYNMAWGSTSTPVPAGTAGALSGYECNINTAQASTDIQSGEHGHCLGGTLVSSNGAFYSGADLTLTINTVAANAYGANINITNNVAGGSQTGYLANSSGTQTGLNAFYGTGKWTYGLNLTGLTSTYGIWLGANNIRAATNIGFSGSNNYFIDGSATDTFRITGGGSSGGMVLYGNSGTGNDGLIRFQNNSTDHTQGASIDGGTGAATFGTLTLTGALLNPLKVTTVSGLTATGTTQGTALVLTKDISVLTTVASGTGVLLQSNIGQKQEILNRGANNLLVYPPTSGQIESNGINNPVAIAIGAQLTFECTSATQCYQSNTGPFATGTATPTLTNCGTSPSNTNATDIAGTVTVGTSAASCQIAFLTAKTNSPTCVVTYEPGGLAPAVSVSTTGISLAFASTVSSVKFHYSCTGH